MNEKREMVAEMLSNMTFREELKEMVVEQLMMSSAQPLAELLTLKQRFSSADYYIPGRDLHYHDLTHILYKPIPLFVLDRCN